jgi:hypothetical protein
MARNYLETLITPSVLRAQTEYFGKPNAIGTGDSGPDPLTEEEQAFIEARDSFYMATVSENGWPYVQHRGGPKGFLRVIGPRALGFADLRGNRQMLSVGNLSAEERVSLFLMDYPHRERLKILGRARVLDAHLEPTLADKLSPSPELRDRVERLFLIDVISFDWNCPQYITPRYTEEEIAAREAVLRDRIATLEAKAARLRETSS